VTQSTRIALLAALSGPILNLLWWAGGIGAVGLFIASCVIYGWSALAALVGIPLASLRPWLMMIGLLSILLWAFFGVVGSSDLTPLIPLIAYSTAITVAFDERPSDRRETSTAR
jgi:hypothetical protein